VGFRHSGASIIASLGLARYQILLTSCHESACKGLKDAAFVAAHLGDEVPERKVLYEDPELGFCILGHVNHGARESKPHDHGPSWAIYGQARGETVMSEWALIEPAAEDKPGKVRLVRKYSLAPGTAQIYNEGDLHSPSRSGSTRLIRIEGQNLEKIHRLAYEAV